VKRFVLSFVLALLVCVSSSSQTTKHKEPEIVVMSLKDARELAAQINYIIEQRDEAMRIIAMLVKENKAVQEAKCI
jgi:beta-lactam-binding protein with PASTA domain